MENDTPSDSGAGDSIERMAIRRVRDSLREVDDALREVEERIDIAPAEHRRGIVRAAALALGLHGDICHEVRREILELEGLYPF
jgi:hypothetical protein